jgi:hypothetical protein
MFYSLVQLRNTFTVNGLRTSALHITALRNVPGFVLRTDRRRFMVPGIGLLAAFIADKLTSGYR